MTNSEHPPLTLSEADMRRLGQAVIDLVVKHHRERSDLPVQRIGRRHELDQLIDSLPSEQGRDPLEVLQQVSDCVLPYISHTGHRRFWAYVPSVNNFVGVMADALSAGFNVFAGHWLAASGPAKIEADTIAWLRHSMGMPASTAGIFLSGGSMANLAAMHVARTAASSSAHSGHDPNMVVYATYQTHACIAKSLAILGFGAQQFRSIAVDRKQAMDPSALRQAIEADKRRGLKPLMVIATAGTTSTGAIDPLPELRHMCDQHSLWLHVDGAYGAAAVLDDETKPLLVGLDRADSIVLDPHKWLFQPYEIGCLLVRQGHLLQQTFSVQAEYLREANALAGKDFNPNDDPMAGEINFFDLGPQLTRSFRALKLWMSLQTFGVAAFRRAIRAGIDTAQQAQAYIENQAYWEIVTPAQLGIVTFRPNAELAAENLLDHAVRQGGQRCWHDDFMLITTTELDRRPLFRLCTIHPGIRLSELHAGIDRLQGFVEQQLG